MIGHRGQHADGVGLAGAVGEGRHGCVDAVRPGVDRREVTRHRHAGGVVAVHDHRQRMPLLDRLHQLVGDPRCQQARHVLDANRVRTELDQFVGERRQLGRRVHRAGRVANRTLCVLAHRLHGANRGAEVAGIVERVEDAEDVHAVLRRAAHESLDHVIGEAGVLDDVLPAQEHHVRRAGRGRLQLIEPVEGVFLQETQGGVDRGAAPGLERPEAEPVEARRHREHLGGGHARGREGLVTVAQDGVVEDDRLHEERSEAWRARNGRSAPERAGSVFRLVLPGAGFMGTGSLEIAPPPDSSDLVDHCAGFAPPLDVFLPGHRHPRLIQFLKALKAVWTPGRLRGRAGARAQ
jgi:hypothetical protein